jgi:hypothetical protein
MPNLPDDARLREIDALIHDGAASDDPLLMTLRGHLPRPRAEYSDQLERALFNHIPKRAIPMQTTTPRRAVTPTSRIQPRRVFPFTAAAAFSGTLLIVALMMAQVNRASTPSAAQQGRATATPLPAMVNPAQANLLNATATLVPTASATATLTFTPTSAYTPTDVLPPTVAPSGATMGQGIIWPVSRLVAREGAASLETGMRVVIYTRVQQFTSWTDSAPGLVREVLVTDNALVTDVLEYAGEYVIALPIEVEPIVIWLFSNDAYFTYELAGD